MTMQDMLVQPSPSSPLDSPMDTTTAASSMPGNSNTDVAETSTVESFLTANERYVVFVFSRNSCKLELLLNSGKIMAFRYDLKV